VYARVLVPLNLAYIHTIKYLGTQVFEPHENTSQIPARCPLFSSLDRASDYAHSPIVAPLSPPRLSCALRPTQMHQVPSLTPGYRWYALRSLSSLSLSSALCRRQAAGEQYATARPTARGHQHTQTKACLHHESRGWHKRVNPPPPRCDKR